MVRNLYKGQFKPPDGSQPARRRTGAGAKPSVSSGRLIASGEAGEVVAGVGAAMGRGRTAPGGLTVPGPKDALFFGIVMPATTTQSRSCLASQATPTLVDSLLDLARFISQYFAAESRFGLRSEIPAPAAHKMFKSVTDGPGERPAQERVLQVPASNAATTGTNVW